MDCQCSWRPRLTKSFYSLLPMLLPRRIWSGSGSSRLTKINILPALFYQTNLRNTPQYYSSIPNRSLNVNHLDAQKFQVNHPLVPSPVERHTIFALSSPPGRGAVAVVRISGSRSSELALKLLRPMTANVPGTFRSFDAQPWRLKRCQVIDPETEEVLDDALAVFFRGKCADLSSL